MNPLFVNRRTAVFVTRTKHVLVVHDQGWSPAQTHNCPHYKISGILARCLVSDKHIFAVLLAHF